MTSLPESLYCFDIVGKVFGDWLNSITAQCEFTQEEIELRVNGCINKLRDEYFSNRVPDIPLSDQFLRWSYLYWAAPANALLFESVLKSDPGLQGFLGTLIQNHKKISVCCIGGGPGSEAIGLAKWTERQQLGQAQLDVLVTDKFPEWGKNWEAIQRHINTTLRKRQVAQSNALQLQVRGRFTHVDAENSSQANRIGEAFDLYTVSYLVSHIFSGSRLGQFNRFMRQVVSLARPGSKFVFIDRAASSDKWKGPIRAVAQRSGLKLSQFRQVPDVQKGPGENESYMLDQGFDLPPVAQQRDAFWVVGTKV
jgi:hypothetical protein